MFGWCPETESTGPRRLPTLGFSRPVSKFIYLYIQKVTGEVYTLVYAFLALLSACRCTKVYSCKYADFARDLLSTQVEIPPPTRLQLWEDGQCPAHPSQFERTFSGTGVGGLQVSHWRRAELSAAAGYFIARRTTLSRKRSGSSRAIHAWSFASFPTR
jgi:hypothetical protein